jgi:hypothetical protein
MVGVVGPTGGTRGVGHIGFQFLGLAPLVLLGLLVACGSGVGPDGPLVRVDGRVVRGPTQPVCQINVACDAPFSAGFSVRRGPRVVVRFRSEVDGRFSIQLAPGAYLVVPDADAPILAPEQQVKSVTIPVTDSTTLELSFDTGIR